MSLVLIKTSKDEYGRPVETYVDTDDMSNEDYAEYRRLEKEDKEKALNFLRRNY